MCVVLFCSVLLWFLVTIDVYFVRRLIDLETRMNEGPVPPMDGLNANYCFSMEPPGSGIVERDENVPRLVNPLLRAVLRPTQKTVF